MTMAKWLSPWPCVMDSSFFGGYPDIGIHMIYSKGTFGCRHSCVIRFEIVASINWEQSTTSLWHVGYIHMTRFHFSVMAVLWFPAAAQICVRTRALTPTDGEKIPKLG